MLPNTTSEDVAGTAPLGLPAIKPFAPDFQETAYEVYRELQATQPVFEVPGENLVLVTRHELIAPVVRNTSTFSSAFGQPSEQYKGNVAAEIAEIASTGWPYLPVMLTSDPPQHTRYRGTVAPYFTPRRIEKLRPVLEQIAARLIDAFPESEPFDIVPSLAVALPIEAIAAVLHLPNERLADFKRWSDDATAGTGATPSDERLLEAARGIVELQRYLAEQLEQRRREPIDDLMTDLVQAEIETDELDADGSPLRRPLEMAEMLSIVRQLLAAGNETSTNALAEGVRLLAENPSEWRKLKADPSRAAAVTEEVLRLAAPVSGMYRIATHDTELGGCPVLRGARLVPMFAAANRDPDVFGPDPDAFDPDRSNLREHVTFGKGIHFCIGAPLARLELEVAFDSLSRRVETIQLVPDQELRYHPSFLLRGLKAIDVVVTKNRVG